MTSASRRRTVGTLTTGFIGLATLGLAVGGAAIAAPTASAEKIRICHRTASNVNPYVALTVAQSSVDGSLATGAGWGDHFLNHTGPVWEMGLPKNAVWGDIIPPIPGVHDGLNWNETGRAVWFAGCVAPVAGDADNDGTTNTRDLDDDNDNIPDAVDPDSDGDGIADVKDPDIGNNGQPDTTVSDEDSDGQPNANDPDDDNDGVPDVVDGDFDDDGVPNTVDSDDDGDGIPDITDPDVDNDGVPDATDSDDDNDGIPDVTDPDSPALPVLPKSIDPDTDSDGTRDSRDADDDNDTITDVRDIDSNGDKEVEVIAQDLVTPSIPKQVSPGEPVVLTTKALKTSIGATVTFTATCGPKRAVRGSLDVTTCTIKTRNGRTTLLVQGAPGPNVLVRLTAPAAERYRPLDRVVVIRTK